jgi:hypothetical protein
MNECDPLSHVEELRFFSSLWFPSGTISSPEGEVAQGVNPLEPLEGHQTLQRRRAASAVLRLPFNYFGLFENFPLTF